MPTITIRITDENNDKVEKHRLEIQKDSIGKITFTDALNHLLEVSK